MLNGCGDCQDPRYALNDAPTLIDSAAELKIEEMQAHQTIQPSGDEEAGMCARRESCRRRKRKGRKQNNETTMHNAAKSRKQKEGEKRRSGAERTKRALGRRVCDGGEGAGEGKEDERSVQ